VGARDLRGASTPLTATLTSQGQAEVQAQVRTDEQLMHPVQCASQVTGTHAVGEEATQVTVMVRVTCRAEVYNADQVQARVTALLNQKATTHLGRAYVLQGEVTPIVSTITTIDARQGVVSLQVQTQGTWAYQLSAAQLHALTTLVAGTPLQQARTILVHTQGIHQVTVTSTDWWDDASQQALPQDPNRIQIVVISWAGM
jgi:VCBS repeat-containing protein